MQYLFYEAFHTHTEWLWKNVIVPRGYNSPLHSLKGQQTVCNMSIWNSLILVRYFVFAAVTEPQLSTKLNGNLFIWRWTTLKWRAEKHVFSYITEVKNSPDTGFTMNRLIDLWFLIQYWHLNGISARSILNRYTPFWLGLIKLWGFFYCNFDLYLISEAGGINNCRCAIRICTTTYILVAFNL